MFKKWGLSLLGVLFSLILFSACVPIPAPAAMPESPLEEPMSEPEDTLTIAQPAIMQLAQQLQINLAEIEVVTVEAVDWPDACLGVYTADMMCATVITPGYRVVLAVDGAEYEYHTNLDRTFIQLFSAPEANIGDVLITWQQALEFCQSIEIGTEGVAFGPCMGVMLGSQLVSPEREAELQELVTTVAPFEADTLAGLVVLNGQGSAQPREAEQRMIAEWARAIHQEAVGGNSSAALGLGMAWHREGGIAGFCNDLAIYVTGRISASNCNREGDAANVGQRLMTADELAQFYSWLDEYAPFEFGTQDESEDGVVVTDAMTITFVFNGRGSTPADEETQQEIISFAQALFTSFD